MTDRGSFASRIGFVLTAAGSAIGLGNIWKFPYITGENGGGLFVLIYLVCIALIGLPIMTAEFVIGRAAKKQPVGAFEALSGKGTSWTGVGWLGILAGFVILSYYIVVAGWAMDYTLKSFTNFTKPIHSRAEKGAAVYRAATPLETMRQRVISARAENSSSQRIASVRRRAPKSIWQAQERYSNALAQATKDGKVNAERAKSILLEDEHLAKAVSKANALEAEIGRIRGEALAEAQRHYASASEKHIRDEAETAERRALVAQEVGKTFGTLVTDGWTGAFWAMLFMLLTILVVAGGISAGIERACRIMMPALFIVLIAMVTYGAFQPGFGDAMSFVFKPDPTKLKASGILEALGHAFFTLSLGMGAMITYGSYLKGKENLLSQSVIIAGLDTFVSLMACMMIFPIIFSYGQAPAAGPGLVFKTMPLAFSEISGGMLLSIVFFALLVVAALTSSISLLEVVASYFIDQRGWTRAKAAWLLGGVILLFGLPSAFASDPSFVMAKWESTFGLNFLDTMDYFASNWLLPLGGLFIAIYAGWSLPKRIRDAELEGLGVLALKAWLVLVRFVAPVLVIIVLLQKVGILDVDEWIFRLFG
jgi:NSS family neurotransmitter:Na+ symporter